MAMAGIEQQSFPVVPAGSKSPLQIVATGGVEQQC